MNGGAELYLAYGFVDIGVRTYQKNDLKATAEIYRMGGPQDAFGIYAHAAKGDYGKAVADCTKATRLRPDDADAYLGRGAAYLESGDYDAAISDCKRVIALRPDHTLAYYLAPLEATAFERLPVDATRRLIRMKALDRWRLYGRFLVVIDVTGQFFFRARSKASATFSPTTLPMLPPMKPKSSTAMTAFSPPSLHRPVTTASVRPVLFWSDERRFL